MQSNILHEIEQFSRDHNLLGQRLIVAVSGGSDSVCLLHALNSLKDSLRLELCVAHLNHELRGIDSDADAKYVEELAENLGLAAEIGQVDVNAFRSERKVTLEEAAREARYVYLSRVASQHETDIIVTGHNKNDQLETILLHILRGSGLRGLAGFNSLTPLIFGGIRVKITRPMLNITKEEILDYCLKHQLFYHTDQSNLDSTPLRNKIRLKLLPCLKTYEPRVDNVVSYLSNVARRELAIMDDQVKKLANQSLTVERNVITIDKKVLTTLQPKLRRHLLRSCFEKLPNGLKDVESVNIEDVVALCGKPAGKRLDLPGGVVFITGYDCCRMGPADEMVPTISLSSSSYPLIIPGNSFLPGWTVKATVVNTFAGNDNPLVAYMDLEKVGAKLEVRGWQQGDIFQPFGASGKKKLAKYMIDAKIARQKRKNIPLVVSPAGVVWLVGYRLDERVRVSAFSKSILRMEFVQTVCQ
ncbi:MAG: tRNA lysidine(34) synthetase TilS [Dehalococcoidia bacterium]|nr:tRNA lysidine(34) synthetase TilS [Dehalococcoidia bacterium]